MRIAMFVVALSGLTLAVGIGGSVLAGKDEVKPFIRIPKTWEAAIEEGKKLNLPIVVHDHGWN